MTNAHVINHLTNESMQLLGELGGSLAQLSHTLHLSTPKLYWLPFGPFLSV
jgi:hypothetical protein